MMRTVKRIYFWLIATFFVVAAYSLTFGQFLPVEFANWKYSHSFYSIILQGLPVAVLLTLICTISKNRTTKQNISIGVLTVTLAVASFFVIVLMMFPYGFGAWVNYEVVYESKENPREIICHQLWDNGALGYDGQRTVKLTPFLGLWNIATETDTAMIDKGDWRLVRKEDDIRLP